MAAFSELSKGFFKEQGYGEHGNGMGLLSNSRAVLAREKNKVLGFDFSVSVCNFPPPSGAELI